jgi:nickel-type superoxide dismutase maturation protease
MNDPMRDQRYHGPRKALLGLLAVAAALWWWRRRPFAVVVQGESMAPSLMPGDFVIAVRATPIRAGVLVVLEHPGRPGFELVKRLAGSPGTSVHGRQLGPDEYWVLGDRTEASTDSRSFGPISSAAITGVVRFRYWPPSRLGPVG